MNYNYFVHIILKRSCKGSLRFGSKDIALPSFYTSNLPLPVLTNVREPLLIVQIKLWMKRNYMYCVEQPFKFVKTTKLCNLEFQQLLVSQIYNPAISLTHALALKNFKQETYETHIWCYSWHKICNRVEQTRF